MTLLAREPYRELPLADPVRLCLAMGVTRASASSSSTLTRTAPASPSLAGLESAAPS